MPRLDHFMIQKFIQITYLSDQVLHASWQSPKSDRALQGEGKAAIHVYTILYSHHTEWGHSTVIT